VEQPKKNSNQGLDEEETGLRDDLESQTGDRGQLAVLQNLLADEQSESKITVNGQTFKLKIASLSQIILASEKVKRVEFKDQGVQTNQQQTTSQSVQCEPSESEPAQSHKINLAIDLSAPRLKELDNGGSASNGLSEQMNGSF